MNIPRRSRELFQGVNGARDPRGDLAWVKIRELAKREGVHLSTIRRWVAKGLAARTQIGPRTGVRVRLLTPEERAARANAHRRTVVNAYGETFYADTGKPVPPVQSARIARHLSASTRIQASTPCAPSWSCPPDLAQNCARWDPPCLSPLPATNSAMPTRA
jgi:hypothetical protein